MEHSELLAALRACASDHPNLALAVVFGSLARGALRRNSDVDLGLLVDGESLELRLRLEVDFGRAAGRAVDLIFLDQAPPLLRFEIAREGQVFLERRPYLWADFKYTAMRDWWDWAPYARRIQAAAVARLRAEVAHGPA
ncbi:MAG TPA: nucleotidyltransferase domain-containing protein [Thermoanaerobaculia bacterium]|jgi:predicted nucleotidyltransferase|nr:nucleotidyltransferase domain-containing protein [Thermoanaerobaculia bacterium]